MSRKLSRSSSRKSGALADRLEAEDKDEVTQLEGAIAHCVLADIIKMGVSGDVFEGSLEGRKLYGELLGRVLTGEFHED